MYTTEQIRMHALRTNNNTLSDFSDNDNMIVSAFIFLTVSAVCIGLGCVLKKKPVVVFIEQDSLRPEVATEYIPPEGTSTSIRVRPMFMEQQMSPPKRRSMSPKTADPLEMV